MTELPTRQKQQQVLDLLYEKMHLYLNAVQEAREVAAYCESLGIDLSAEADHMLCLQLANLKGLLFTIDILRWTMGYSRKHQDEVREIEAQIQSHIPNLPTP